MLFVLEKGFGRGKGRAFLSSKETSAFPEEQEYLIGAKGWKVRGIDQETKRYRGGLMEVVTIALVG